MAERTQRRGTLYERSDFASTPRKSKVRFKKVFIIFCPKMWVRPLHAIIRYLSFENLRMKTDDEQKSKVGGS